MIPSLRKVIAPPAEEPITVSLLKSHCRIDHDDEDETVLPLYIAAAREWIESQTSITMIDSVLEYAIDCLYSSIEVPSYPLISVTSVKYRDENDTEQTLDSGLYNVDTYSNPPRINAAYNEYYPTAIARTNAVVIRYRAGYPDADSVPKRLKHAVLLLAADWYENREDTVDVKMNSIPNGIWNIIYSLRNGVLK